MNDFPPGSPATSGPTPVPSEQTPVPSEPTPVPSEQERRELLLASGVPEELHHIMGPHGVAPLNRKLGIRMLEMSAEKLVATMPVAGNEQNIGILHGGAHFVLAESLGSIAALLHVYQNLGEAHPAVGTELSATHHRSAREGMVTATCTPLNLGRQITSHEIVMRDDDGRRLSTARMTNMILRPR